MAAPNEEELRLLPQFRERVSDILPKSQLEDDYFLLRWMRARDLDLCKAENMLRIAFKWRMDNKVDELLETKLDPYFEQNYPRWLAGKDKEGRPIYIAGIGKWDIRNSIRDGKQPDFHKYTTEGFELLVRNIKKSNEERGAVPPGTPPITQIIAIFDFEGFSWSQLLNYKAMKEILDCGAIYEAYYPEILHRCYLINTPSLISQLLAMMRPILAPKTFAKIKVMGKNKEEWKEELLSVIGEDQLIPELGGTYGVIVNDD